MSTFLIINADDFGLTPGINRGILRAFTRGALTSATIMANGTAWQQAVDSARSHPGLGVGVHLNLTSLRPVLSPEEVPSLVDKKGNFRRQFWRLSLVNKEQVKSEWRAQIKRLVNAGLKPTHLDSHHHVHLWGGLVDVAWDLAEEFSIPAMRAVSPLGLEYMDVSRMERMLAHRGWRRAQKIGAAMPDSVAGLEEVGYARAFLEAYMAELSPGVHELFCHPGVPGDSKLVSISSLTDNRVKEMNILCSSWFQEILTEFQVEPTTYGILAGREKSDGGDVK